MQAESTCIKCRYFDNNLICPAFPDGIPVNILIGEFDHTVKHPDQKNNIIFEPINTKTAP